MGINGFRPNNKYIWYKLGCVYSQGCTFSGLHLRPGLYSLWAVFTVRVVHSLGSVYSQGCTFSGQCLQSGLYILLAAFTTRVVHPFLDWFCCYRAVSWLWFYCVMFLVLLELGSLMAMVLLCNVLGFAGIGQSHGYGSIV